MTSVLSSFFSRDPRSSFQYDIPTSSFTCYKGVLFGNSFKKSEINEKATCLWSDSENLTLKLQTQKLKTLRHPNVLTYLDSLEIESGLYLITEPCEPLEYYLNRVNLKSTHKELFVSWGFYQILNCLNFLHNEVKISQNNLKESIFITGTGDWKLSGFHAAKPFSSSQADLNDLALVAWQIFNSFVTNDVNLSKLFTNIPKCFQPLYKKLASTKNIFSAYDLIIECRSTGGLMKNNFVDTLLFLDEFQLKDANEKQTFFMQLKENLDMFPDDVAKRKILPKLLHTYEYGDAGSYILVPMFKLSRLLDEDEYQYRIVPCLVKLFSSSDRSTRVKLLEKIDEFKQHLNSEVINENIYGNLVTGFLDTNPAVRESTVKAMVSIAEKLNYYNLNTDLMKHLARLQGGDEQPGIRTNATICLGKIGCFIDSSHRQRILICAFARALKDPFPPARMAGILALSATQQYYSLIEVATKIVPSLSSLTVDPEKQVRDQSFKALKGFLEKLEKASDNPDILVELEAQVKAGGRNGILASEKVPQWASWALKTLSEKFYKPTASSATATATSESILFNANNTIFAACDKQSFALVATDEQDKSSSNVKSSYLSQETKSATNFALWKELPLNSVLHEGNKLDLLNGWGDIDDDDNDIDNDNDNDNYVHFDENSAKNNASKKKLPLNQLVTHKSNIRNNLKNDDNNDWNDFSDLTISVKNTKSISNTHPMSSLKISTQNKVQHKPLKTVANNLKDSTQKTGSGPMKLGAKKIKPCTKNTNVFDEFERDLFGQ